MSTLPTAGRLAAHTVQARLARRVCPLLAVLAVHVSAHASDAGWVVRHGRAAARALFLPVVAPAGGVGVSAERLDGRYVDLSVLRRDLRSTAVRPWVLTGWESTSVALRVRYRPMRVFALRMDCRVGHARWTGVRTAPREVLRRRRTVTRVTFAAETATPWFAIALGGVFQTGAPVLSGHPNHVWHPAWDLRVGPRWLHVWTRWLDDASQPRSIDGGVSGVGSALFGLAPDGRSRVRLRVAVSPWLGGSTLVLPSAQIDGWFARARWHLTVARQRQSGPGFNGSTVAYPTSVQWSVTVGVFIPVAALSPDEQRVPRSATATSPRSSPAPRTTSASRPEPRSVTSTSG